MLFSRTAVQGIYTLCYLNLERSRTSRSSLAVAAALGGLAGEVRGDVPRSNFAPQTELVCLT